MQVKPKLNSVVTHSLLANGALQFTVRDAGSFLFNPTKVHASNRAKAELHGWIQRISDGAAIGRDPETGVAASAGDKLARMERIAQHYESGTEDWGMRSAGGAQTEGGLVILGIVRAGLSADVEAADALVQRLMAKRSIERAAALKVFADTQEVGAAIAAIRAERAAAAAARLQVSAEDLLGELSGDED